MSTIAVPPLDRGSSTALPAVAAQLSGHVPALDGVRGIAILLVLLYHFTVSFNVLGVGATTLVPFHMGWCGVDVFFALSGFLITGILLDSKSSPQYFRSFYARRILRIFPLYYGALFVVFLLATLWPTAGTWGVQGGSFAPGSLLWPLLFLENVGVAQQGAAGTGILTHFWSLAVEEHFYMVWPLLIWLTTKRQALAIALLIAGISIAARAGLWLNGTSVSLIFGLTPLRMDGLAIGAMAAIAVRSPGRAVAVSRLAAVALPAALLLLLAVIVGRHTTLQADPVMWIAAFPLVSAATASALVLALAGGWTRYFLSRGLLRWFGKYSYGLYVWHPIIGVMLFHSRFSLLPADPGPGLVIGYGALVFALNLIVAWLSFNLWEKRFLDLKRYFMLSARPAASVATSGSREPAGT